MENIELVDKQIEQLQSVYNQLITSEHCLKQYWREESYYREKEIFGEIRRLSELKSKLIICTLPEEQQKLFKPPDIVYVDKPVEKIRYQVVTRHPYWSYFFTLLFGVILAGESILYCLGCLKIKFMLSESILNYVNFPCLFQGRLTG